MNNKNAGLNRLLRIIGISFYLSMTDVACVNPPNKKVVEAEDFKYPNQWSGLNVFSLIKPKHVRAFAFSENKKWEKNFLLPDQFFKY